MIFPSRATHSAQSQCSVRLYIDSDKDATTVLSIEIRVRKYKISLNAGRFRFSRIICSICPSHYYTIESIMTNISFPDDAIAYIVQYFCSKYNIWYSFISKQFLLHEWYFLLIINIFGGIAGHTVCHWLVSQSSSKWTLPLAGVVVAYFYSIFFRKLNTSGQLTDGD